MKTSALLACPLVALSLTLFSPSLAEACSSGACWGGFFLPSQGTVPTTLPAIEWLPLLGGSGMPDASGVSFVAITPNGEMPVAFDFVVGAEANHYLLKPLSPLTPNTDYVVRAADYCTGSGMPDTTGQTLSFRTSVDAALPNSLGTLSASPSKTGSLTVTTWSGSCATSIVAAQVAVDLTLSSEAEAWKDALDYETIVDGQPWTPSPSLPEPVPPGESWQGRGHDLLFALCSTMDEGADKGLSEGIHTVLMRATLPGTGLMLATTPITVTLACEATTGTGGGSGTGGSGAGNGDTDDSGGCSVATLGSAGRDEAPWSALALGALALLMHRRRKGKSTSRLQNQ